MSIRSASATNLSGFNVDGRRFLNDLYRNSRYLSHAVSRSCKSSVKLVTQSNGENASCIELHVCTPEPIAVTSLACMPAGSKLEGFQLSFFVHVCEGALLSETKALISYLRLLHIVNPDICMSLQSPATISHSLESTIKPEEICFDRESYQTIGAFQVALGTEHYTLSSPLQVPQKMHFVRGSMYHLHSAEHSALKLYCCAAMFPHIKHTRSKVRANKVCSAVRDECIALTTTTISVFGPTAFASLAWSGAHLLSDITSLVQWSDYGLKASGPTTAAEGASLALQVTDCRAGSTCGTQARAQATLHILVFLEGEVPSHATSGWDQWACITKMAVQLEKNFGGFLACHKAKFRQASCSALNKILHNYKTCEKAQLVATVAIREVSEAVADIISHSSRDELPIMCAQQLQPQVSSNVGSSLEVYIREKLLSMATQKDLIMTASDISPTPGTSQSKASCPAFFPRGPSASDVAQGPYLDVQTAPAVLACQFEDLPRPLDMLMAEAPFGEEPNPKPIYALVGAASVQSTSSCGSPFEWSPVQHAVDDVMGAREQTSHTDSFNKLTEDSCNGTVGYMSGKEQEQLPVVLHSGGCKQGSSCGEDTSDGMVQELGSSREQEHLCGHSYALERFSCRPTGDQYNLGDPGDKNLSGSEEFDDEDFSGTGEEEDFSNAGVEEGFSGAGDFSVFGDEEDFSGAGDEEDFSGAGDEEGFSGAGDEEGFSGAGDEEGFSGAGDEENFSGAGDEEDFSGAGDEEGFSGAGDEEDFSGAGDEEGGAGDEDFFTTGDEEDFGGKEGLGVNRDKYGFVEDDSSEEYGNSDHYKEDMHFTSNQDIGAKKGLCIADGENVYVSSSRVSMHTKSIHKQQSPTTHSADYRCKPCLSMNATEDISLSDAEWDSVDTSLSR